MKGNIKPLTYKETKDFLLPKQYPKGKNKNYILGEFLQPNIIKETKWITIIK